MELEPELFLALNPFPTSPPAVAPLGLLFSILEKDPAVSSTTCESTALTLANSCLYYGG